MSRKGKERASKPNSSGRPWKGVLRMAVLAGLGVAAGLWLSPSKSHNVLAPHHRPVPVPKGEIPQIQRGEIQARLAVLWASLGVEMEAFQDLSNIGHDPVPAVLEVMLPKAVGLEVATQALEELFRDPALGLEISWSREEKLAREAVISQRGHVIQRILLREHPPEPKVTAVSGPRLAIVVDDVGADQEAFRALLALDLPLTLAILPGSRQAGRMAAEAHARGLEVMIHLPMEPKDYLNNDPGPQALRVSMTDGQIEAALRSFLSQFPQAVGANNHMGSRFTEDPQRMSVVMELLSSRGMFFVDSMTTPHSVAYYIATRRGVPAYKRDVFLDNDRTPERIREQFRNLLLMAKKKGQALAICHPYPETLAMLPELHRESWAQGVSWVKVSELSPGPILDKGSLAASPLK